MSTGTSALRRSRRATTADNLLAPPPTFVDRCGDVADIIYWRASDAIFPVCGFCYNFRSITNKRSSENFEDRTKFFREPLKKVFGHQRRAAPPSTFWTGGASPPTQ